MILYCIKGQAKIYQNNVEILRQKNNLTFASIILGNDNVRRKLW